MWYGIGERSSCPLPVLSLSIFLLLRACLLARLLSLPVGAFVRDLRLSERGGEIVLREGTAARSWVHLGYVPPLSLSPRVARALLWTGDFRSSISCSGSTLCDSCGFLCNLIWGDASLCVGWYMFGCLSMFQLVVGWLSFLYP